MAGASRAMQRTADASSLSEPSSSRRAEASSAHSRGPSAAMAVNTGGRSSVGACEGPGPGLGPGPGQEGVSTACRKFPRAYAACNEGEAG